MFKHAAKSNVRLPILLIVALIFALPAFAGVTITSPTASSTVGSPVHVTATASSSSSITKMQLWVDQVAGYSVNAATLDTYVSLAAGSHRFVVLAYDASGATLSSGATYATVGTVTAPAPAPAVAVSVSPTSASLKTGATQQFTASVTGSTNTAVTWLVNGVQGGSATTGTISTSGLYTAPTTAPASAVTITAKSTADTTKSASATVTVTAPAPTTSLPATAVKIISPVANSTVTAPVAFSAQGGSSIVKMQLWLDSVASTTVNSNVMNLNLTLAAGSHRFNVIGYDTAGASYAAGAMYATVGTSSTPSTNPTAVGVAITPASATIQTSLTQQFTSSVSGTTNTAVTWLVNGVQGGNSTTGTVSSTGLYTAPATAPSSAVTVAAQSVADTTKSASASVTVTAAPKPVTVAITPTSVSLAASSTKQFTATVSGTTNTGVNWLVNGVQGGSTTVGTISTAGVYTAPSTSASVTVTAKSAYDSTASASASVAVTATSTTNPAPQPSGTQYYVSTSGSDSNSGSQSSPWKTLTYAASKAGAGTTVHVAPGTYNSSSEMKLASSGNSSARVVFISDQQWGAKIVSSVSGNSTAVWITGDYVDFVGFDITAPGAAMGVYITGSNDRIIGNHVHSMATSGGCPAGGGILNGNYSGASNVDIIGNVVHDIGVYNSPCSELHGIYTANPGGHIWNNIVFRNQGWGIHLWHAASQNNVSNNTVVNNGYGGILIGAGDGSWVNTGTVVTNNVVYQNGLFSGSGGFGIEEYGNIGTNTYKNNLVYGNGPSDWNLKSGSTVSGSISGNPLFATYTQYSTTNDYHLQSTSPALGKGVTTYAPTYDMNGATRSTSTPTLGVYEYGGSSTWPYMY